MITTGQEVWGDGGGEVGVAVSTNINFSSALCTDSHPLPVEWKTLSKDIAARSYWMG